MKLLHQEPAPVTPAIARLTTRYLSPVIPELEALLYLLRADTDRALAGPGAHRYGTPYPVGYCREITQDVLTRLDQRLATSPHLPAVPALRAFLSAGGAIRCVWGALRGTYFQTALQFGTLYVDVANDTVTPTKPKVEILPFGESGLEPLRDPAHFAGIAWRYWGMRAYANHALPAVSPLLPMVTVSRHGNVALADFSRYMVGLACRHRFRTSEDWLAVAPAPPGPVADMLRAQCPRQLLAANPEPGRAAALAACRASRARRLDRDAGRAQGMVEAYRLGMGAPGLAAPPQGSPGAAGALSVLHVRRGDGAAPPIHPALGHQGWREVLVDAASLAPDGDADPLLTRASVGTATMDAVFSSQGFAGKDPEEIVADLTWYRRVLKPGGLALVTYPDPEGAPGTRANPGTGRASAGPTANALFHLLDRAGFVWGMVQRDGQDVWALATRFLVNDPGAWQATPLKSSLPPQAFAAA